MDSKHRFGALIRCTNMVIAKEKQEIVYHKECIYTPFYTTIAL